MKIKSFYLALLIFCFGLNTLAQTKTNLEKIDSLISQSVNQIDSLTNPNEEVFLEITTPASIEILKGKIISAFSKHYKLINSKENAKREINYFLENVDIDYSNPQKEGFFGSFVVERTIKLSGNILIRDERNSIKTIPINNSINDRVYLDEIRLLEDSSLPFTQSEIPAVPILSNLFEPIVVVGTLIVTTILLFTVRSK
jgi:hypothetical protein